MLVKEGAKRACNVPWDKNTKYSQSLHNEALTKFITTCDLYMKWRQDGKKDMNLTTPHTSHTPDNKMMKPILLNGLVDDNSELEALDSNNHCTSLNSC